MLRRIARTCAPLILIVPAALSWLGGCGGADVTVAEEDPVAPVFVTPDASEDVIAPTEITYCASNKCPEGWTTCPNSRFPCDVNLARDIDNCGACGNACPPATGWETYACVNAECVVQCSSGGNARLDCDGIADNGCETSGITNQNCGACGNTCPDPANPCINIVGTGELRCGCPVGQHYCRSRCTSKDDDLNCGACNNRCNARGDGGTPPPNQYYGCKNEQCGALKCTAGFDDCDGIEENGCETSLRTITDCGGCGVACSDGQICGVDSDNAVRCMCPPGETFCSSGQQVSGLDKGLCANLATDQFNCGACGASCLTTDNTETAQGVCKHGVCVTECHSGMADCNDSEVDGCEVNLNSDPRNCGACGNACDAVAGQACVAGRCVVEPCDVDAGGGTTR